jgi:mRNA interferase MazF
VSAPKIFGVYTAQFPFLDSTGTKIRPVIVISQPHGTHKIIAIVPVSSKLQREDIDVGLAGWNDSGLLKPSVARVHRLTTMLQADLIAELGVLTDKDTKAIQNSLKKLLNL